MKILSRLPQQHENHTLGMGLAFFILVYFVATVCFILFK